MKLRSKKSLSVNLWNILNKKLTFVFTYAVLKEVSQSRQHRRMLRELFHHNLVFELMKFNDFNHFNF